MRSEKFINNEDLTKSQIFEKARKELNPIQENLAEKKITIDEAGAELKKINEWIQWTNLEQKDKKEIWKVFEDLAKLEQNVDKNVLKNGVDEIIKLLEGLTQKDLASLKQTLKQTDFQWSFDRPTEVQQGIQGSSKNLDLTINDASEDKNIIASWVGKAMKRLNF